ncbi:hypothetical protein [Pedobacter frigiditerrae]|uniref:hypothetical protein n=1 Tax=Pedobacter frigiditerrae TaxID=2530452 RepID=UPI002930B091|nr:hypothetical protein [Pedobacter frigiditerrae]
MTKEQVDNITQEIKDISSHYEERPYTENVKLLKEDFDIKSLKSPKLYREAISELEELLRESRLLFLYSLFNIICEEEGKPYLFDIPYQASMSYDAVLKKEGSFYIRDEDGDYSEIFTSEKFVKFIDDLYWEVYE